ncbi:MAG: dCTP deaminase [Candidatus Woesearchaeota archaeon]|nr:dCTP deaminase [Candidatus Woesearchaeota archaeon]
MILTGEEIKKQVKKGNIIIRPFNLKNVTTNSYDLTLGQEYLVYTDKILDPARENKYIIKKIPKNGLLLRKGDFVLGHSKEIIGGKKFVPLIHAKSGIARLGLFVHITADLIDIGSIGNTTFQLYATKNIRIYSGMLIGQVSFWVPKGKIILYEGKYQNSIGPKASQIHKDFKKKLELNFD